MVEGRKIPLVYVIILNYCSYEDSVACIESARRISYSNVRILVLDNASSDGSGDALKNILVSEEYIQLDKNLGYAGGNNYGISYALKKGAEYIFIVNPDVRLSQSSISDYLSVFEGDDAVGAVGPVQLGRGSDKIDKKFEMGVFNRHGLDLPPLPLERGQLWEVDVLYGAALFVPSSTFRRVGGFDPLFFAYGEEEDFCSRVKRHGLKLLVTSNSPVVHLRTKEADRVSDTVLFLRLKGIMLFNLKTSMAPFLGAFLQVVGRLGRQLLLPDRSIYPYNLYPVGRLHTLRAIVWLVGNAWGVRRNVRREAAKVRGLYLETDG